MAEFSRIGGGGSVLKTYPPNLKGFEAKTTRKWYFLNPYLMEFGSEWHLCLYICDIILLEVHGPTGPSF